VPNLYKTLDSELNSADENVKDVNWKKKITGAHLSYITWPTPLSLVAKCAHSSIPTDSRYSPNCFVLRSDLCA